MELETTNFKVREVKQGDSGLISNVILTPLSFEEVEIFG
jgi:hypothetical protein